MLALVEFKLVTVAEVEASVVTVPDVEVRFVSVALPEVSVVMLAEVMLKLASVKLVATRFVIVAEVLTKLVIVPEATLAVVADSNPMLTPAASWNAIVPRYWFNGIWLGAVPTSN